MDPTSLVFKERVFEAAAQSAPWGGDCPSPGLVPAVQHRLQLKQGEPAVLLLHPCTNVLPPVSLCPSNVGSVTLKKSYLLTQLELV